MLYTGHGDKGDTTFFGGSVRVSKTDPVVEALGALDELNSLLGVCRTKTSFEVAELLRSLQHDLFIIQAELADAPKAMTEEKVKHLEDVIEKIDMALPPIRTFFVPGATESAAFLDLARTVARRAERRLVAVRESGKVVSAPVLQYMNRLSSVLYAVARQVTHSSGITEEPPTYR